MVIFSKLWQIIFFTGFGLLSFQSQEIFAQCLVNTTTPDGREIKISRKSRKSCIKDAKLFFEQPVLTTENLYYGDVNLLGLPESDELFCKFIKHPKSGSSPKFRCNITNEKFEYYSKNKDIISNAKFTSRKNFLLDVNRKKIFDNNSGKNLKAYKMRVKYTLGEPRHREVFTEIAVTRIFWALGIYADQMYMKKVNCLGCSSDPFSKKTPSRKSINSFYPAAIEKKVPGKEIEYRTDQGWSIRALRKKYKSSDTQGRVEIEAFVLAANMVHYHNPLFFQNRITCLEGHYDKQTGVCEKPVIYIHDLGSTFGSSKFFSNPRGDYFEWKNKTVFSKRSSCKVRSNFGSIEYVSEQARSFLSDRLKALDDEKLMAIFSAARFDLVDPKLRSKGIRKNPHLNEEELNKMTIEYWIQTFKSRIHEVQNASCPDILVTRHKNL